jgi:DHA2 family metal-tetracycline-proton antiporter-like MFS transporter
MPKNHKAIQKITLPLSFIIFFSVLNGTMFQVAIPDISQEYLLLPSEVSWVMTGYILVFAIGALIYGKLADMFPVKRLITIGLIVMNLGSLMGLVSIWYPMLISARLMQAMGGAAIPALAMIVVTRYFPPDMRGKVLGIIASTVALAAGLGPIIGGFITGIFHWRYLFLTSLATILMIPSLRRILPHETVRNSKFDIQGALLIGGGASCLLVFVTQGQWWFFLSGALMIYFFVVHIRRVDNSFINPELFMNRAYSNTLITTFISMGTVFGMLFMVPIMLRDLNVLDANLIGLTMFPGAMSAVVMGVIGGRISDRKGSRFVVYIGAGSLISGFLMLSTFAGMPPKIITLSLITCYAGFAFLQSSLPHTVSIVLPKEQTGIGMGIYNLLFFMSGAFSTAGIGRLLDLKSVEYCFNPLSSSATGCIYSNIFILLAVVVAIATLNFHMTFRRNSVLHDRTS